MGSSEQVIGWHSRQSIKGKFGVIPSRPRRCNLQIGDPSQAIVRFPLGNWVRRRICCVFCRTSRRTTRRKSEYLPAHFRYAFCEGRAHPRKQLFHATFCKQKYVPAAVRQNIRPLHAPVHAPPKCSRRTIRVHFGRTASGDCHHRYSGRDALTRRPTGPRSSTAN